MVEKEGTDVLEEVHSMVKDLHNDGLNPLEELDIRLSMSPNDRYYQVLKIIDNHGTISSSELSNVEEADPWVLTRLYRAYLIDRSGTESDYVYSLNKLGKRALQNNTVDSEQSDLTSVGKPWESTPLSRNQYYAAKCVAESEGPMKSSELDEKFMELSETEPATSSNYAITPYLSKLYKDGIVGRPPEQPYVYWLTEKGKSIFND